MPGPLPCTDCRCRRWHAQAPAALPCQQPRSSDTLEATPHIPGTCSEYIEPEDEFDANPRPEEEAAKAGEPGTPAKRPTHACTPATAPAAAAAGASEGLHLVPSCRRMILWAHKKEVQPERGAAGESLQASLLLPACEVMHSGHVCCHLSCACFPRNIWTEGQTSLHAFPGTLKQPQSSRRRQRRRRLRT